MSETRLDNQLLELAYDELDEASAATLRSQLARDADARARYEAMRQTRDAFALLDGEAAEDRLPERARTDLLRQARLTAAALAPARERRTFAWLPALGALATVLLVAVAVWLVARTPRSASDAATDPEPSSEIVARGAELDPATDPAHGPMARLDPEPVAPESVAEEAVEPTAAVEPDAEDERAAPAEVWSEPAASAPSAVAELEAQVERPAADTDKKAQAQSARASKNLKKNRSETEEETKAAPKVALDANEQPVRLVEKRAAGASAGSIGLGEESTPLEQIAPSAVNAAEPALADDSGASELAAARTAYEEGRFADAVALFDPLTAGVHRTTALYYRGLCHQRLGDHLGAVADLRIVVEGQATFAQLDPARFALATSLEALGNRNDARTHYELLAESSSPLADDARLRIAAMGDAGVSSGDGSSSAPARAKRKKKSEASPSRSMESSPRSPDDELLDAPADQETVF